MIKYTSIKEYRKYLIKELGSLDDEVNWDAVSNSEDHLNIIEEEIFPETNRVDPNDSISLSRLKHLYTKLDKEVIQLRLWKNNWPMKCLRINDQSIMINHNRCISSMRCVNSCPWNAFSLQGKKVIQHMPVNLLGLGG